MATKRKKRAPARRRTKKRAPAARKSGNVCVYQLRWNPRTGRITGRTKKGCFATRGQATHYRKKLSKVARAARRDARFEVRTTR